MTIYSKKLEREYLDIFNTVFALYSTLNDGRDSLHAKHAQIQADGEVAAEALDFLLDVEMKITAAFPYMESQIATRMIKAGNHGLLRDDQKLHLGKVFFEFGLGPEGAYRKLFFKIVNDQARQARKGVTNAGPTTDGRCIE